MCFVKNITTQDSEVWCGRRNSTRAEEFPWTDAVPLRGADHK